MSIRRSRALAIVQRSLAWAGLALMALCFVWVQLLPPLPHFEESAEPATSSDRAFVRVIIDAGHGGQDSGTMRDGVLEKDLTLDVARRLDQLVRAKGLGTMLTRSSDEYVSLANRANAANQQRDCVFVSIHFDEGNRAAATGVNTYYAVHQITRTPLLPSWLSFVQPVSAGPPNLESESLAGFVQQALVKRTQAVDRGTRSEQFYVIANVRHPAVLVEGGFLTNNDDMAKLRSEDYRQQLAAAICEGIMRYREISAQRAEAINDGAPRA